MASLMTKEEPLLRQLVRTRALNTREGSASPTRRTSHGASARSASQPPPRMPRPQPAQVPPLPQAVYTLQLLPYSLVYPPTSKTKATPKVSFCSVSQPDLTKITTATSPSMSRCSTPSMTISGCGSPSRAVTPTSWFYSPRNSIDANNNEEFVPNLSLIQQSAGVANTTTATTGGVAVSTNVCKCPLVRKNACFSSLCCEICKLFPNQEKQQQSLLMRQHQQMLHQNKKPEQIRSNATTATILRNDNENHINNLQR